MLDPTPENIEKETEKIDDFPPEQQEKELHQIELNITRSDEPDFLERLRGMQST